MAGVVAGVFNTSRDAEHAVQDLLNSRFSDDNIGVVVHDSTLGPGVADDLGREYRAGIVPPDGALTSPSDVFENIPGGFMRTLQDEHAPAGEMDWFKSQLNTGKIMLIVNAGDRTDDAMRILHDDGAMLFEEKGAMAQPETMTQPMPRETTTESGEFHVPVIDEEVVVQKTQHQVGEVQVVSDTYTESVDVPTTVTHQEIRVERRKLDHPLRPDEYHGTEPADGTIRMPIIEEEVTVSKRPIIREEFIVTRVPVTEQQTLHETVMHAEPEVQTTGDVNLEQPGMRPDEDLGKKRRPAA